jgi:hypothetical protein
VKVTFHSIAPTSAANRPAEAPVEQFGAVTWHSTSAPVALVSTDAFQVKLTICPVLLVTLVATPVARVVPFSSTLSVTVGLQLALACSRANTRHSCSPAPTVGGPEGVGNVTRRLDAVETVVANRKLASGLSGSS